MGSTILIRKGSGGWVGISLLDEIGFQFNMIFLALHNQSIANSTDFTLLSPTEKPLLLAFMVKFARLVVV
jgi:hypothetical protein